VSEERRRKRRPSGEEPRRKRRRPSSGSERPEGAGSFLMGRGKDKMPKNESGNDLFYPVPFRFKIPRGETRKVLFLTSFEESFFFREHQLAVYYKGKQRFGQGLTCADQHQKGGKCPLCELGMEIEGLRTTIVRIFTVLDLTPYTNKRTGETRKYSRVVLAAKNETADRLAFRSEKISDQSEGTRNLKHALLEIRRGGDKLSPAVGSDFEWTGKHLSLKKFAEEDRKQFGPELFAPDMKSLKRAAKLLEKQAAHREKAESSFEDEYGSDDYDGDDAVEY